MPKIATCLWFDRDGENAARFYVSVFKNSRIRAVTHYGEGMPLPATTVLTVAFTLDGREFLALNGGPVFKFNPAVSFVVPCRTQKEIDAYWRKLSAGGAPGQCGWLTDQFGVSWQIVPAELPKLISSANPARARRVLSAIMKMEKLDLRVLKRAYRGGA
ncbi:MAG TPA: VOC family protein [Elusimicrobiota bacterium]|nr:VOC family protein [Elusimicrobiota bacterium]